jgi:serine/threonine protein kinase
MKLLAHKNLVRLIEIISDEDCSSFFMVLEHIEGGPIMRYNPSINRFVYSMTGRVMGESTARSSDEHWLPSPPPHCPSPPGEPSGILSLVSPTCTRTTSPTATSSQTTSSSTSRFPPPPPPPPPPVSSSHHVQGNLKLSDFGVSSHFSSDRHKKSISLKDLKKSTSRGEGPTLLLSEPHSGITTKTEGTFPFYSPEMCSETSSSYSAYMADTWAASVCLWIFVFGQLPFYHPDVTVLFQQIR